MKIQITKAPSAYVESVEVRLWQILDRLWEKFHSLDFGTTISVANLDVSGISVQNAVDYQPIGAWRLRLLLNALFDFEKHRQSDPFVQFVDVGCGKGKPCIYAKRLIGNIHACGFDFSANLVESAKANALKAGYDDIDFTVADASEYMISGGRAVIFLFNPFDEAMLRTFLSNNIEFIRRTESILLYVFDYHRNVPSEFGLNLIYRTQRAWGSFWSCTVR